MKKICLILLCCFIHTAFAVEVEKSEVDKILECNSKYYLLTTKFRHDSFAEKHIAVSSDAINWTTINIKNAIVLDHLTDFECFTNKLVLVTHDLVKESWIVHFFNLEANGSLTKIDADLSKKNTDYSGVHPRFFKTSHELYLQNGSDFYSSNNTVDWIQVKNLDSLVQVDSEVLAGFFCDSNQNVMLELPMGSDRKKNKLTKYCRNEYEVSENIDSYFVTISFRAGAELSASYTYFSVNKANESLSKKKSSELSDSVFFQNKLIRNNSELKYSNDQGKTWIKGQWPDLKIPPQYFSFQKTNLLLFLYYRDQVYYSKDGISWKKITVSLQ